MLDRILQSPTAAIGFIVFVIILGMIYLVNRERAQVARMKGPRRFQPDWRRTGAPRSRRRRRRRSSGTFSPTWNRGREPKEAEPDSTESDG